MKANELRIGSIVYIGKEINIIELVDFADIYENDTLKQFEPIPLTEEWLINFGFELCDNTKYNIWSNEHFVITDILMQGDSFLWFIQEAESLDLDYVHQLQNLYFALTGEELTIKTKQL